MALPKLAVPTHNLIVPSSGKRVSFRPYLVKEEKLLMMAMESNSELEMIVAVKSIIESCTEGELTEKDITMFDLEYFFTHLRAKSVGETSTVSIACTSCEHKNEQNIDISRAEVLGLPKDKKEYIKDVNEEVKVKLRYPTIARVIDILSDVEKTSDIDLAYKVIGDCVDEIYFGEEIYDAKEQTPEELQSFIESMNSKQFNTIRQFVEAPPTVALTHEFDCEKCDHHNKVELKGLLSFFS